MFGESTQKNEKRERKKRGEKKLLSWTRTARQKERKKMEKVRYPLLHIATGNSLVMSLYV